MSETYFIVCITCDNVFTVDETELANEIMEHSGHNFVLVRWSDFEDLDRTEEILKAILRLQEY